MGIEIERKFLVRGDVWESYADEYVCCRQGYFESSGETTIRVRIMGEKSFLTIKGASSGITRSEFEYEIPLADAEQLLTLCGRGLVEKRRYFISYDSMTWEVDVFLGLNEGLVIAEVELESEEQTFELPEWIGSEVSEDSRYRNSNLAFHPFNTW